MHCVELHQGIKQIFELLYRLGLWSRGEEATVREKRIKYFYSIYHLLFVISLLIGSIKSDNSDESIFLLQTAIMVAVMLTKLLYIIWKQKEIVELCRRIGSYSVDDDEEFTLVNRKLNTFVKVAAYFFYSCVIIACIASVGVPFIGNERKLFFNIGFPMDYKNNEVAYWIAFVFVSTEIFITTFTTLFSIIMWYLMFNCSLKYQVLGNQLRNMGVIRTVDTTVIKLNILEVEKEHIFLQDLIAGIESHKDINESTQQLEAFLSNVFAAQLATSAFCICTSVYCLTYYNIENLLEGVIYAFYLFFNIFNIFMVMNFGNEIKLSSDRLSYCLFESNWIDRTQSTKKCMIIFGERLKQAQQLVVLKLYPLTLETFTRILNSAYSMFNILKNLT